MSLLQYQTVQVSGSNIVNVGGPCNRGQGLSAAGELLSAAMQALDDYLIRRRVNQDLARLEQVVRQMLHNATAGGGVLICAAIEETRRPGGVTERNLRAVFIAGQGRTVREALNEFLYGSRIWQTPPPRFTRRESFVWITGY